MSIIMAIFLYGSLLKICSLTNIFPLYWKLSALSCGLWFEYSRIYQHKAPSQIRRGSEHQYALNGKHDFSKGMRLEHMAI